MIPIFYINIDERIDRKIFVENQLKELNLKARRISAVTPKKISKKRIQACFS